MNGFGNLSFLQEKRSSHRETNERDEDRSDDCTELKKRGLCLVPLSMIVNYLG